jgi:hypothetical protein
VNGALNLVAEAIFDGLQQDLEGYASLIGKTVTMSIDVDGTINSTPLTVPSSGDVFEPIFGDWYFQISVYGGILSVYIIKRSWTLTPLEKIRSVKLELGSVSTLANDPPADFGEELRKCQRYFYALNCFGKGWPLFGYGFSTSTTNSVVGIPIPVTMRIPPTVTFTGTIRINKTTSKVAVSSISESQTTANNVMVNVTHDATTANSFVTLEGEADTTSNIFLSAEL